MPPSKPSLKILRRLFSLENQTALITGASGGIGRALAIGFAEAGARVALHGQSKEKLATTAQFIEKIAGKSVSFSGDLAQPSHCKQLVREVVDTFGTIDILVNCAGVNRRKSILKVSEEDFDFITSLNLKSLFFLSQTVAEVMREKGKGKIINIGSVSTSAGLGGVSVYGATKAAVGQLTKTMALEWAQYNIQVNCLAPGFILTPLTEKGLWGDPHRSEWLKERIALKRPGKPEELIGTALLLASQASSYLTGQVIHVDGGYLAGGSWLLEGE